MSGTLFVVLALIIFICGISFLIKAFSTSLLWGLGVLFIPFVEIVFAVRHWARVKGTVLTFLGAFAGMVMLVVISESTPLAQPESSVAQVRHTQSASRENWGSSSDQARPDSAEPAHAAQVPAAAAGTRAATAPQPALSEARVDPFREMGTEELLNNLDRLSNRQLRVVYDGQRVVQGYPRKNGDQLLITRRQQGGTFVVHIPIEDVHTMELVR